MFYKRQIIVLFGNKILFFEENIVYNYSNYNVFYQWFGGLVVRTPDSHLGDWGSIPGGVGRIVYNFL